MNAQQDQEIVHDNRLHTHKQKVKNTSVQSQNGQAESQLVRAAFYDVDGTIIRVMFYILTPIMRPVHQLLVVSWDACLS